MKAVLGLDTSNYVTSLAAVDIDGSILLDERIPLRVATGTRGLQQSEAVFQHVRNLAGLFAGWDAKKLETVAVCASTSPRAASDSYMPVFVVGAGQGIACAQVLGVPFYTTNHQNGHIRAALHGGTLHPGDTFFALHLSGGTTEMLQVSAEGIRKTGGTLDLHAGQLIDRVGVALGLPFPAGPHLEKLARAGHAEAMLGVSIQKGWCHLSGAEAQAMRWIAEGEKSPQDIAAELYDFATRTVARLIQDAQQQKPLQDVLLAGGVSSSLLLRDKLRNRLRQRGIPVRLHFAAPGLSGDNAVGVALIGLEQYKKEVETCRPC